MKINNVTNNAYVKTPAVATKQPKANGASTPKIGDKIEISEEAKNKLNDIDYQKVNEIKAKIADGDYDSDDVISKVADKILQEIESPKE